MTEYNDRVAKVATDILDTIKDRLAAHEVTHQEYRAAWAWLMKLANSGEVPLFLDVFFEAAVERSSSAGKPGSEGAIQGPYHTDHHRVLERPYRLPMRPDEPGELCRFVGHVVDLDGEPIAGASVDMWQSGNDGTYSGVTGPDAPPENLRGVMTTDDHGVFDVVTIRPAPYQIPNSGPTGEFLEMLGRHSWRPAHFHFTIDAPGHEPLTSQIYFAGDPWLVQGDCCDGVKDSLVIKLEPANEPSGDHSLPGTCLLGRYEFALRPAG